MGGSNSDSVLPLPPPSAPRSRGRVSHADSSTLSAKLLRPGCWWEGGVRVSFRLRCETSVAFLSRPLTTIHGSGGCSCLGLTHSSGHKSKVLRENHYADGRYPPPLPRPLPPPPVWPPNLAPFATSPYTSRSSVPCDLVIQSSTMGLGLIDLVGQVNVFICESRLAYALAGMHYLTGTRDQRAKVRRKRRTRRRRRRRRRKKERRSLGRPMLWGISLKLPPQPHPSPHLPVFPSFFSGTRFCWCCESPYPSSPGSVWSVRPSHAPPESRRNY